MTIKGTDLFFDDVRPGDVIRIIHGKAHPGNRTYHVRSWDDTYLIVRIWSRRWQHWIYEGMTSSFWAINAKVIEVEREGNIK